MILFPLGLAFQHIYVWTIICYLRIILFTTEGIDTNLGEVESRENGPDLEFRYHDHDELTRYLRAISASYPALTALYSIGKSVQGTEQYLSSKYVFFSFGLVKPTLSKFRDGLTRPELALLKQGPLPWTYLYENRQCLFHKYNRCVSSLIKCKSNVVNY